MKTTKTILISGAKGEFSESSGLDGNAKNGGAVILKNVVFQDQNLWAGYGTPLDNRGTVVIEEVNSSGETVKTWKLKNSRATNFLTAETKEGDGPTFSSIELSHEGITTE